MKVVLDTCILFSGLRSSSGASYLILRALESGKFVPLVSVATFLEYEEVLKRPKAVAPLTRSDVDDFLDYFASISEHRTPHYYWRPVLKDSDDDALLELAVDGGCERIVTHNIRDFSGSERFGVRAILPREFIKEIKL